jgi:redox-sensitive bicupin YhaK (pirin superfamily)
VVSGKGGSSRRLKVSAEPIELANVAGRTLFPSPIQGAWLPFERFAESRTSERNDSTLHSHGSQEVLTYVLDGTADSEEEGGTHTTLPTGWVDLLLAEKERQHELASADGAPARWLSVVLRLPPRALGDAPFLHQAEACRSETPAPGVSLTVVRSSGPQNPTGLELIDLRFGAIVTWEHRIPVGHRGLAYVLDGDGAIDGDVVSAGVGILVENVTGFTLRSSRGFRVVLASAPHASS